MTSDDEKMTVKDFCNKIMWEGGVIDALDYGLRAKNLDPHENPEFYQAWCDVEDDWSHLEYQVNKLERMADEIASADDGE